MKKSYIIVFSVLFSFSMVSYASVESLLKTPVAKQSYESAGSSNTTNNKESYAEQLAKVRAIMEKAKKEAKTGKLRSPHALTLMSQQAESKPVAKLSTKPLDTSTIKNVAKELESQMNQLHQSNLQYQQTTNQKIGSLASQNKALASKLQKLTQAMLMMNQQLSSMSGSHHFNKTDLPKVTMSHHSVTFSSIFKYLAFGVAALLAVLIGVLIARQKKE